MCELFKILHDQHFIKRESFFTYQSEVHDFKTRSVDMDNLVINKCHLDIRKNSFCNRVIKNWNSLPIEVRYCKSLNEFKKAYDDWKKEEKENEKML